MTAIPTSSADILASKTRRGLPREVAYPEASTADWFRGLDNFHRVFCFRPGDHVVFLTDPLLDPRVVQAIYGHARARGATFASYMGTSTQLMRAPEESKALIERATFVVSTWFASIHDPFIVGLRRTKGQRWVKITYFRNLDLLKTPQARFPMDVLAEIIQGTARLYPESGEFDLRFTDPRGSDVRVHLDQSMKAKLLGGNRWRGKNVADEDGCYIHYLPTHGPNLYDRTVVDRNFDAKVPFNGILYPQWAVGFAEPFKEKIGIEFKDERVVAVTGQSREAEILREHLTGGLLEELGCGHNPWAPRFDIYPAGPNSPGGLHFGINGLKPSAYMQRMMPHWEEPHVHMDLVTFDSTVTAGNRTLIDEGYLLSLKDPQVIAAAEKYGNPHELLEAFPV
jgi:hypothetical protein